MYTDALLTDLYQLTMAYGYWRAGIHRDEAVFHLFYRSNPFGGGYAIAAGLADAARYLEALQFSDDDVAYLATVTGNDRQRLFPDEFLEFLRTLRFTCDVEAVAEGTLVFPHEPLVRVRGPVLEAQLVESALLNIINFQTLIATKAARAVQAADGDPVVDFGLRRAQGRDGALSATRAAFIGGVGATSNVLAGAMHGIPVKGTHAHSWVMMFDTELESFEKYAEVMPNNTLLLVDTYDTVQGVKNAIKVATKLRERGHRFIGVRLDSGDLAYLSIEARRLLDEAGFTDATIAASNDLDERLIRSLKDQKARIDLWGVGTKLVTAFDQPALGGVYKLSATRREGGEWEHRIKLSEQTAKVSNPGMLQVRRFIGNGEAIGDMLWDELSGGPSTLMIDPLDLTRRKRFASDCEHVDLLEPVLRGGRRVRDLPAIADASARRSAQLALFHEGVKRFDNPHRYPVGLEEKLHELKTKLVLAARDGERGR